MFSPHLVRLLQQQETLSFVSLRKSTAWGKMSCFNYESTDESCCRELRVYTDTMGIVVSYTVINNLIIHKKKKVFCFVLFTLFEKLSLLWRFWRKDDSANYSCFRCAKVKSTFIPVDCPRVTFLNFSGLLYPATVYSWLLLLLKIRTNIFHHLLTKIKYIYFYKSQSFERLFKNRRFGSN